MRLLLLACLLLPAGCKRVNVQQQNKNKLAPISAWNKQDKQDFEEALAKIGSEDFVQKLKSVPSAVKIASNLCRKLEGEENMAWKLEVLKNNARLATKVWERVIMTGSKIPIAKSTVIPVIEFLSDSPEWAAKFPFDSEEEWNQIGVDPKVITKMFDMSTTTPEEDSDDLDDLDVVDLDTMKDNQCTLTCPSDKKLDPVGCKCVRELVIIDDACTLDCPSDKKCVQEAGVQKCVPDLVIIDDAEPTQKPEARHRDGNMDQKKPDEDTLELEEEEEEIRAIEELVGRFGQDQKKPGEEPCQTMCVVEFSTESLWKKCNFPGCGGCDDCKEFRAMQGQQEQAPPDLNIFATSFNAGNQVYTDPRYADPIMDALAGGQNAEFPREADIIMLGFQEYLDDCLPNKITTREKKTHDGNWEINDTKSFSGFTWTCKKRDEVSVMKKAVKDHRFWGSLTRDKLRELHNLMQVPPPKALYDKLQETSKALTLLGEEIKKELYAVEELLNAPESKEMVQRTAKAVGKVMTNHSVERKGKTHQMKAMLKGQFESEMMVGVSVLTAKFKQFENLMHLALRDPAAVAHRENLKEMYLKGFKNRYPNLRFGFSAQIRMQAWEALVGVDGEDVHIPGMDMLIEQGLNGDKESREHFNTITKSLKALSKETLEASEQAREQFVGRWSAEEFMQKGDVTKLRPPKNIDADWSMRVADEVDKVTMDINTYLQERAIPKANLPASRNDVKVRGETKDKASPGRRTPGLETAFVHDQVFGCVTAAHYFTDLRILVSPWSRWKIESVGDPIVIDNNDEVEMGLFKNQCGKVVNLIELIVSNGERSASICALNAHLSFAGPTTARMKNIYAAVTRARNGDSHHGHRGCDALIFTGDFNSRLTCQPPPRTKLENNLFYKNPVNWAAHWATEHQKGMEDWDAVQRFKEWKTKFCGGGKTCSLAKPPVRDRLQDELAQLMQQDITSCYTKKGLAINDNTLKDLLGDPGLREAAVPDFPPTYKMLKKEGKKDELCLQEDRGLGCFRPKDDHKHNPSWTDRILIQDTEDVKITTNYYKRRPALEPSAKPKSVKNSDHVPVVAGFTVKIARKQN